MAETRRRFRNKKRDDGRQGGAPSTPVTIARREDARNALVQPKILLKKETESNNSNTGSSSSNNEPQLLTGSTSAIKTIIINRSSDATRHSSERGMPTATTSASVCAALTTASNKEKPQGGAGATAAAASTAAAAGQDGMLGPPRMTRPTTLLMSNGAFNANARKLFHKTNTDFTVIGVLGAQSVGKSTLLNLLSAERDANYDYYGHLFAPDADECIFSTRHRSKSQQQQSQQQPQQQQQQQSKSRRTESLQFFITRERFVLLDSVSFGKEAEEQQELPTLSLIMQLLSVCHVLLLAVDELSLEQVRLLQTALRLRPRSPIKSYVPGHLPQLMFVRTRAQRQHFEPAWRECFDRQLTLLFEASGLPMHRGRGEARVINSFVLPLVRSNAATCHHPELFELVREFRERVLTMQRISMCPSHDFSESLWFDLMAETTRKCNSDSQHFESIFGDIKHRHFESLCSKSWRNNEGVASVSASASNSWRNDA